MTTDAPATYEDCVAAGRQALRVGRVVEARAHFERALALARDDAEAAEVLGRLGVASATEGQYAEGERLLAEAMQRAAAAPEALAQVRGQMGIVRWMRGDMKTARAFLEQAQADFKRLGLTKSRAMTLTNLGLVFKAMGQYQRAIDALHEAIRLGEALGETSGLVIDYNNLGECYADLGAMTRAETWFRRGIDLAASLDAPGLTVDLRRNLGRMQAEQGALAEGAATIEQALVMGREYQRQYLCAQALDSLADVRLAQGAVAAAQALADELLALDATVPTNRARARLLLGRCALAAGESERALPVLQEGLLDAQKAVNEMLILRFHAALSQVVSHPAIAQVHRRIARELAEQMADGLTDRELQQTFRNSKLMRALAG